MESLKFILSLISNYKFKGLLNILFNGFAVLFSLVSLAMVGPFLGILFDESLAVPEAVPQFHFTVNSLIEYFKYNLSVVILENGKAKGLLFICLLVAVVFFFKNVFRYAALYVLVPIRNGVVKDLREKVYDKILKLPISYLNEKRKGDILTRISVDVVEVEWGVLSVLESMFKEPLTIFLYLAALLYISPLLTMIVLVVLPLTGFFIATIAKSLKRTSLAAQSKQSNLISIFEETLGGLRIVKAFNAQNDLAGKFEKENSDQTHLMNRVMHRKELASPLTEVLAISVVVLVLYIGGKIVLKGEMNLTAEAFITFMLIFSQIINPAKAFTTAYYRIVKGIASMDRIKEILNEDDDVKDESGKQELSSFNDSIEYKNVGFHYDDDLTNSIVLKNVNGKIAKGQTIALVGPSGAGKSTFVDLLARFFEVKDGAILIDGQDLRNFKIKSLRSKMGIVSQDPILFNDTVFNNIALGVENASRESIINAAKIANAHLFIEKLDNGYDTFIGDRGNKLSGGEKQRLTIARAVLKNPPILILDEATSSLDAESEKLVQEALIKLMENRTSIVIAHRLSTIQHADEIWVMKDGEVVERGKHEDLLAFDSFYKKLATLQGF